MKKIAVLTVLAFALAACMAPVRTAAAAKIPVVVVESFEAAPAPSQPGEVFSLEIVLKNQGQRDAENVSLTIGGADGATADETAGGPVFLPVESGNVIFLGEIEDGKKKTVTLKLVSGNDTAPGIYDLDIKLDYAYSRATFSGQAKIGIIVEQRESLVLKGLSYPSSIKLGETAVITGDIVNISNGPLKAVTVDYAGDNLEKQSEFYGIFEPNNSDSLENSVTPDMAGTTAVDVIVSYYDSFGKKKQTQAQAVIEVVSPQSAETNAPAQNGGLNGFLDVIRFLFGLGG